MSSGSNAPGRVTGSHTILHRLQTAGACSPELASRVVQLGARSAALPARAIIQGEEDVIRRPRHLISGWACRWRMLADGRRQIFDFVLPGDGIAVCLRPTPAARSSISALTPVRLTESGELLRAETLEACPELAGLLLARADDEERRLLDHVVRLGRLTALERLAHLLLELRDRLAVIGEVEGERFALPVTQETLADALGLSVVHVNRTLQELKRQDLAVTERGQARLLDVAALRTLAGCA